MPSPRDPQKPAPEAVSGSQHQDDEGPTEPFHANPITRIQILTGGYITRHPRVLTALERLGWNNPGGSINL